MTEKTSKLTAKLERVRKNINDSKRLIAYHKKMLKIYLRKEAEINEKLEREQFADLYKTVRDNGCDILAINAAIKNGEFTSESEDISADDNIKENNEKESEREEMTD